MPTTTIALTTADEQVTALAGVEWTQARQFPTRPLRVESVPTLAVTHLPLTLEVLNGAGNVVAERAIILRTRMVTDQYIRVAGSDRTQTLRMELTVSLPQDPDKTPAPSSSDATPLSLFEEAGLDTGQAPGRLSIAFDAGSTPPGVVLPVLRFLQQVHAPNVLAISVDTDDGHRRLAIQEVPDDAPGPAPSNWLDAVRSLAFVQRAAGVTFPIPDTFTDDDLSSLRRAATLLRGDVIEGHWETLTFSGELAEEFEDGQLYMLEQEGEYSVTVAGHRLSIGDAYHWFRSARVVAHTTDAVSFEPGPYPEFTIRLAEPPPRRLDDPLGSLVQLDVELLERATR